MNLADTGSPPDPEDFADAHPEIRDDLISALEGLSMVRGLVGSSGTGVGHARLETGKRLAGYRIVRELGRGGMGVVYDAVHVGLDRPVARQGSGLSRFAGFDKLEAFFQRGADRRRLAPHAHRTGVRRRADRFALLLRDAKDRWNRARPRHQEVAKNQGNRLRGDELVWLSFGDPRFRPTCTVDRPGSHAHLVPRGVANRRGTSKRISFAYVRAGPRRSVFPMVRRARHARGGCTRARTPKRRYPPRRQAVESFGRRRRLGMGGGLRTGEELEDPGLTLREDVIGTPKYMSPEQADGQTVDHRTDVYSLGATLYEQLTLKPPFDGSTTPELTRQIRTREPATLRKYDPRVPRDLETIVLKAMAKRPGDRYQTAGDLRDDLSRYLRHEPVKARRIGPVGRLWRFSRRHPGISAVTSVAALVVFTIATLAYVRVVAARDRAIEANQRLILRELDSLQYSTAPNRREHGATLVREALAMKPGDAAFKTKLRDELLALLGIRDVVGRRELATGHVRSLAFASDRLGENELLALSREGDEIGVWELSKGVQACRRSLVPEPNRADPGGAERAPAPPWTGRRLAVLQGGLAAAILTDGAAAIVFDAKTGEAKGRINKVKDKIVSIQASVNGGLIATVEQSAIRTEPLPKPVVKQPPQDRRDRPGGRPEREKHDPPPAKAPEPPLGEGRLGDEFEMGLSHEVVTLTVRLWVAAPGEVKPLDVIDEWTEEVGGMFGDQPPLPLLAVEPMGRFVAVARLFGEEVKLWNLEPDRRVRGLRVAPRSAITPQTPITAMAIGPSGMLAVAGGGLVRIWDVDSNISLPSIRSNEGTIRIIRFSPRGTLLALAGMSNDFEIWDPFDQSAPVARSSTPAWVEDVSFSRDGRKLAVACAESTSQIWEIFEPVGKFKVSNVNPTPAGMSFRMDGKMLALGSWTGMIRLWGLDPHMNVRHSQSWKEQEDGAFRPELPPFFRQFGPRGGDRSTIESSRNSTIGRPITLTFDSKNELVVAAPKRLWKFEETPRWPFLDPRNGKAVDRQQQSPNRPAGGYSAVGRSADGKTIVAVSGRELLVWRVEEAEDFVRMPLPNASTVRPPGSDAVRKGESTEQDQPPPLWWTLGVSPDGRRAYGLSSVGRRTDLTALDLSNGTSARLLWNKAFESTCFALDPSGLVLAVGDRLGKIRFVSAGDCSDLGELATPGFKAPATIAFSPKGRIMAFGVQEAVYLWSLEFDKAKPGAIGHAKLRSARELARLPGHRGNVTGLAFSPDGELLASSGSDDQVVVWNFDQVRQELAELRLDWDSN